MLSKGRVKRRMNIREAGEAVMQVNHFKKDAKQLVMQVLCAPRCNLQPY